MSDSAPGLNFIIIGASVSGIASAISLKKSGHSVLVLEKDPQLGGAASGVNGCARICPNGSKILLDWGLLEGETRAKAAAMPGFSFLKYNAGYEEGSEPDFLGENRWNEDLLFEARGGYMQFRHQTFMRLLYDEAMRPSAPSPPSSPSDAPAHPNVRIVFGAEVTHIDCDACTVTLASGEIHTGDAIIGADGARGLVRQTLMREEGAELEDDVNTGLAVYSAIIPKSRVFENNLDAWFYDDIGSTIWVAPARAAWIFPVGGSNDLALSLYTRDSDPEQDSWTEIPEKKLAEVVGESDIRLQKLFKLAEPPTCVQLKTPYTLESWVSESGRVVALGEAAHPSPPAGLHPYSVALEDAVFIGKIFSHTRSRDRIPEFLYAFQEHREARCHRIRDVDMEYVQATVAEGEMHDARDAGMRANHAAGKNAMEGNFQEMLEEFATVFGYDATDDADEWWINWGRFRGDTGKTDSISSLSQATLGSFSSMSQATSFSSVTSCVDDGHYDGYRDHGNGSDEEYGRQYENGNGNPSKYGNDNGYVNGQEYGNGWEHGDEELSETESF
ncbi:hypothetical protein K438DRAFT_1840626 [Mycena galopus ATCC 62051]|nr:hypothetical protein K438DRAFT_1840626 [Mycena galopus ATCC 62051]